MFAFLPKTNAEMCGISKNNSEDNEGSMKLSAKLKRQTISLVKDKALKYKEGLPNVRSYDACYYEINTEPADDKEYMNIYLKVSKLKNMNVYAYGG